MSTGTCTDKKSCALVQADIGNLEKAGSPEARRSSDCAMHVVAFSRLRSVDRSGVPAA
jgi:hypothetical protein